MATEGALVPASADPRGEIRAFVEHAPDELCAIAAPVLRSMMKPVDLPVKLKIREEEVLRIIYDENKRKRAISGREIRNRSELKSRVQIDGFTRALEIASLIVRAHDGWWVTPNGVERISKNA